MSRANLGYTKSKLSIESVNPVIISALYSKSPHLAIVDEFVPSDQALRPFAVDDYLLRALSKDELEADAVLHFWPGDPAIYLGMVDTRLPDFQAGVDFLKASSYSPVIRPSGGLAVVSDPGILNFSLLIKPAGGRLSIDDAYEVLLRLINQVLAPYQEQVQAGEITRSYCPGSYDLSLQGKKIAGLAQRRIGSAIGISAYVSLEGDQIRRGQLIRDFYQASQVQEAKRDDKPDVLPESMHNISDVVPELGQLDRFKAAIQEVLSTDTASQSLLDLDQIDLSKDLAKMSKRNQDI